MKGRTILDKITDTASKGGKMMAVLIDPDKFPLAEAPGFFEKIPAETTHIFIGGSTVKDGETEKVLDHILQYTRLPTVLFPGSSNQICHRADALLFLSLLSGRNPEYLIGQQLRAVPALKESSLEIIPTAYLLIDGGWETAVQRVTGTTPICQKEVQTIVDTALAGQFSGKRLIYLEAGSGAEYPVGKKVISEVKRNIRVPLIVGGGLRSRRQIEAAYSAGADMVVVGTAFEGSGFLE